MNLGIIKKFLFIFICFFCFSSINECYAEGESGEGTNASQEGEKKTLDNVGSINCYQGLYENIDSELNTNAIGTILDIVEIVASLYPPVKMFLKYGKFWVVVIGNTIEDMTDKKAGVINVLSDLLSLFTGDVSNQLSFQQAFRTNKYCKYQDIFQEEDEFLKETSGDRYSMFPVYPYESQHNNNEKIKKTNIILDKRGQCTITDDFINENMKLLSFTTKIVEAVSEKAVSNPIETKCSYSYSSGNIACVLENALPLVVTAEASSLAVAAACAISGISGIESVADPSKLQTLKNVLKIVGQVSDALIRVGGAVGSSLLSIFAMPIFQADAYSITQYYGAYLSTTGVFSMLISIAELNYACIIATITQLTAIETVLPAAADITADIKYNRAKKLVNEIKFCGYDWNNYAGKYNDDITKYIPLNSDQNELQKIEYYEKGMFKGSYGHAVVECLSAGNNESTCDDALKFVNGKYTVKSIKDGNLDEISPTSMDLRNRLYREFLYNGKEYTFPYHNVTNNQGEPVSYDPRLTKFKGYKSVSHKYYMRGNDKANYACNRFIYNGLGCFLKEDYILEEDRECFKGVTVTEDGVTFYPIQGNGVDETSNGGDTENYCKQRNFLYAYGQYCEDEFNRAYEECITRSRTVACIENTDIYEIGNDGKDNNGITFCKASGEVGLEERQSLYLTLGAVENGETEGVCNVKYDKLDGDSAGGNLELLAVKKPEGEYICVYTFNNCPYDFKLNAGLNYKSGYCEADYVKKYSDDNVDTYDANVYKYNIDTLADSRLCGAGIFNYSTCKQLRTSDGVDDIEIPDYNIENGVGSYKSYAFNKLKNDLTTDYYANDYFKIFKGGNTSKKTAAYGKLKNFCQYKAHCVKVEKDEVYDSMSDKVGAFVDQSCNGKSAHSRNVSEGNSRQLTATVAECVYETLKNLVNGVAGYSSCKSGFNLNTDGYCGTDTKDMVEKKQKTVAGRQYLNSRYNFIKGYTLPEDVNPALKLQRNFRNVIVTVLSLSLIVWGFKMIVLGEYKKIKDFANRNFIKSIMPNVIKLVVVIWLALGSGWRDGLADRLFDFTSAVYEFSNRIILGAIADERNQVLSKEVFLGIEQTSYITGKSGLMCFNAKKGAFGWSFEKQDEDSCDNKNKYVKLSDNSGISGFVYFIDNLNKNSSNYEYKIVKVNFSSDNGEQVTDDKISFVHDINDIWNNKYDGCYFDTSEYEDSKSYIALFDSIDCRIVKYLGFAPNLNIANVFLIALVFIFSSTLGSALLSLVMTFVFAIFNLVLEILYIFIMSFFTLSLMIFVSPIILPLALFKRTESIFKKWLDKIVTCVFQPAMLVVAVVLFLNILDALVLKDMTFIGHTNKGRYPNVECTESISLFCIINDPKQVFNLADDTISEGFNLITGIIKSGEFDLESISLLKLIFDVLVIFILFWLGDTLISYAKQISEHLFGKSGIEGNSGAGKMIGAAQSKAKAVSNETKQYMYGQDGKSGFIGATFSRPAAKIDHLVYKKEQLSDYLDKYQEKNKALASLRTNINDAKNKIKDKTINKVRKGITDKIDNHYKKKQDKLQKFEKKMDSISRADKNQKRQMAKLLFTTEGIKHAGAITKTILHNKDKAGGIRTQYVRDNISAKKEKYETHKDKLTKLANADSYDMLKLMDKTDDILSMNKNQIKEKIKSSAKNKFEEKKAGIKSAFNDNKVLRMFNTGELDNKKFIESSFSKEFDNDITENRRMIDDFLEKDKELKEEYNDIKRHYEGIGETPEDDDILYELIERRKEEGKHVNKVFESAVLNLKEDMDIKRKYSDLVEGKGRIEVQKLAHEMKKLHGDRDDKRKARNNDVRQAVDRKGAISMEKEEKRTKRIEDQKAQQSSVQQIRQARRNESEQNNLIYKEIDNSTSQEFGDMFEDEDDEQTMFGNLFGEKEIQDDNNKSEQNNDSE